jgi:hypothetical protein
MSAVKRIVILLAVAAVVTCSGEDSCEEAYHKLEECGIGDSGEPRSCQSDKEECIAKCVIQSTCDDIMGVTEEGDYEQCLAACNE